MRFDLYKARDNFFAAHSGYALRHWDGLTLYIDDGRIEMDTNAVERAMRPITSSSTPRTPFLPVATRAPRIGQFWLR
ncbi:hypothetical protein ACVWZV_009695 [Bradyrhizobium sp. GM5.1]